MSPMKKLPLGLAVASCALASVASAQESSSIGVRLRAGYYLGSSFRLRSGNTGSLNGLELAVDFPFSRWHRWELAFTPAIVLGGALGKGGDTDGQVYRFSLSLRSWISSAMYAHIQAGFAHTEARNSSFKDVNDFTTGVALGFPIGNAPKFASKYRPTFEAGAYLSPHRQLNGLVFSLGFSF